MEKVYSERQQFGRFYYRFPNGEAGTDVFDRVSDFWSSLLRSMDKSPVENLVLVSHGLLMRIFCMVYFHWTVEDGSSRSGTLPTARFGRWRRMSFWAKAATTWPGAGAPAPRAVASARSALGQGRMSRCGAT
ncbi:unnamed protein product [Effrenium voratum]|nr:unnamed protein product [Effrenium voratum]